MKMSEILSRCGLDESKAIGFMRKPKRLNTEDVEIPMLCFLFEDTPEGHLETITEQASLLPLASHLTEADKACYIKSFHEVAELYLPHVEKRTEDAFIACMEEIFKVIFKQSQCTVKITD